MKQQAPSARVHAARGTSLLTSAHVATRIAHQQPCDRAIASVREAANTLQLPQLQQETNSTSQLADSTAPKSAPAPCRLNAPPPSKKQMRKRSLTDGKLHGCQVCSRSRVLRVHPHSQPCLSQVLHPAVLAGKGCMVGWKGEFTRAPLAVQHQQSGRAQGANHQARGRDTRHK